MAGDEESVVIRGQDNEESGAGRTVPQGPIEPESGGKGRKSRLRLILLLAFVAYALLHAYHAPILEKAGSYLVVSHDPGPADAIVCLSGHAVESGLASADLYERDLAPRVLIFREVPPDGYEVLSRAGIDYPRTVDLLRMILNSRGVPDRAVVESDEPAESTEAEASMVKSLAAQEGWSSLILVTSPTHSRRALWTFRKLTKEQGLRVQVVASPYSEFEPADWWKHRRYLREVIMEYQKLIAYWFKHVL